MKFGNVFKLNPQPTSWVGMNLPFSTTIAVVSKILESHSKLSQGFGTISEATPLKSPVVVEVASTIAIGVSQSERKKNKDPFLPLL